MSNLLTTAPVRLSLGGGRSFFAPASTPPLFSHHNSSIYSSAWIAPSPCPGPARPIVAVVVGPQDPVRRAGRAELENPRNHHTRTDAYHIWYIPLLGKPPHLWTTGNVRIGVCLTNAHPTTWTTCWAGGINETTQREDCNSPGCFSPPTANTRRCSVKFTPSPKSVADHLPNPRKVALIPEPLLFRIIPESPPPMPTTAPQILSYPPLVRFPSPSSGVLNEPYRRTTIMSFWEIWHMISWLVRQTQHLANVFPIFFGIPRCLRVLTTRWTLGSQPPVLPSTVPFPPPRVFLLEHALRTHLTSHPRNDRSPSPLQASYSPEPHHTSPKPSPTPEPSCPQATPVLNRSLGKWCCSACGESFRGQWECKRHIETAGRQAQCLACKRILGARDDSLARHFTKHCKGDVSNLKLEDAFVEV